MSWSGHLVASLFPTDLCPCLPGSILSLHQAPSGSVVARLESSQELAQAESEDYGPTCWTWLKGPWLSPDLMAGEDSSCMKSGLPGLTDGQPQEKPHGWACC